MPTGGNRPNTKGKKGKTESANLGDMGRLYSQGGTNQQKGGAKKTEKKQEGGKKQDGGKKRVAQKGGCGCANIVLPN